MLRNLVCFLLMMSALGGVLYAGASGQPFLLSIGLAAGALAISLLISTPPDNEPFYRVIRSEVHPVANLVLMLTLIPPIGYWTGWGLALIAK